MDEQTAAELKRLEGVIQNNVGATRGLSARISALTERVTSMENHRKNDLEKDARIEQQIEDLSKLLYAFKTQFDTFNGIITGLKWVGSIFGALVVATVLAVAGMLWNFNSDVTVLKTKVERIDR